MVIYVVCLFPDAMQDFLGKGILSRAQEQGHYDVHFVNLRDFSIGKYRSVDDYPYAKRTGMLLRPDVITSAIRSIENFDQYRIIYPCPTGELFSQKKAAGYTRDSGIILLCGYYEGVDERIFDLFDVERVSLGDYVLFSGELPAMTIIESVVRLLPGVIRDESIADDSLAHGLLEHPQFTQPRTIEDRNVPEVLVSGHHRNVADWMEKESLRVTLYRRPDLLNRYPIEKSGRKLLTEILKEDS